MRVSDFDYDLPAELIAQHPLSELNESRMLIVDRGTRTVARLDLRLPSPAISRKRRSGPETIPACFRPACLGRAFAVRGAVELLLLREIEPNVWTALTRPRAACEPERKITFCEGKLCAEVIESLMAAVRVLRFESEKP